MGALSVLAGFLKLGSILVGWLRQSQLLDAGEARAILRSFKNANKHLHKAQARKREIRGLSGAALDERLRDDFRKHSGSKD